MVITISNQGIYQAYNSFGLPHARQGWCWIRGAVTKEDDFTRHLFIAHAHNYLLIFTEQGQVHWKRVYEIPEGNKVSKGRAVQNLINIQPGDNIKAILKITNLEDEEYLANNFVILCTEKPSKKDFAGSLFSSATRRHHRDHNS